MGQGKGPNGFTDHSAFPLQSVQFSFYKSDPWTIMDSKKRLSNSKPSPPTVKAQIKRSKANYRERNRMNR